MGKINKDKLSKLWNKGVKAGKKESAIVKEASALFKCSTRAVRSMVKVLELRTKEERIKSAQRRAQNVVTQKVFVDSLKLYDDNINLLDTAKRTLGRVEGLVALNQREIEQTKGKNISRKTQVQQRLMIMAIRETNDTLKTLIKQQELLINIHQYDQLKKSIIRAAERVSLEMKQVFLQELRKEEMRMSYLFNKPREEDGDIDDAEVIDD